MAEFMSNNLKVNGHIASGEFITMAMDNWVITTAIPIAVMPRYNPAAPLSPQDLAAAQAAQGALDKLVEIIAMRGQPVVLSAPTVNNGVYTLSFGIEHAGSWGIDGSLLLSAIMRDGINFGFTTDTTLTVSRNGATPVTVS